MCRGLEAYHALEFFHLSALLFSQQAKELVALRRPGSFELITQILHFDR